MKVDNAYDVMGIINDRHDHDAVLLHSIDHGVRELAKLCDLWAFRQYAHQVDREHVVGMFEKPAEIPSGENAKDLPLVVQHDRNATPLGEFTSRISKDFAVEFREGRSLQVSLRTLPSRPTVVVLDGV